jgi:hypothetical protein
MNTAGFALPKPKDAPGRRRKPGTAFKVYDDGREVCLPTPSGRREYQSRIEQMWYRDHGICCICNQPVPLAEATFEHKKGRGMGGGHRDDRIADADGNPMNGIAHISCNGEKGSRRL